MERNGTAKRIISGTELCSGFYKKGKGEGKGNEGKGGDRGLVGQAL